MTGVIFEDLDIEYASALADRANRLMLEHGVAPTSANFAIWFDYSRGTSSELRRAMDFLIVGKVKFDAATCQELFTKYVSAAASKAIRQIPEQLRAVMAEAKRYVASAIFSNQVQIRAIGEVAEKAQEGIEPTSLVQCLMEELAKATARATEREATCLRRIRSRDKSDRRAGVCERGDRLLGWDRRDRRKGELTWLRR